MTKRAKHLDKKEVVEKLQQNAEFKRELAFVKEKFWPVLCETADSIEDATMFLSGFNTAIMQAFLGLMKEKKFSDLELDKKIAGDFEKYKTILALFEGMNIFEAKNHIENMTHEIALFQQDENRTRKLDSLPQKWIDDVLK